MYRTFVSKTVYIPLCIIPEFSFKISGGRKLLNGLHTFLKPRNEINSNRK
jgi:hypothetical protein